MMTAARRCIALQALKRRRGSFRLDSDAPPHIGSDEADVPQKAHFPDYQPLPLFGFAVRRNCYIHRRMPDCRQLASWIPL